MTHSKISLFLGKYPEVELLDHMKSSCCISIVRSATLWERRISHANVRFHFPVPWPGSSWKVYFQKGFRLQWHIEDCSVLASTASPGLLP
ncbi:uncharacterized protein AAG666_021952 isoform 1-T5 [Megaptera novaeangliae]